jgi:glycerol-3-phosphate acyltransferase PlsY
MSPVGSRLAFAAASYLLGAFPTGYLAVRLRSGRDVRSQGSGGTGATNVLRASGWATALPVAVIDMLKGAAPAWLALRWLGDPVFAGLAAALAVLGHCYPISLGFRGGKGVATGAGAMAVLAPLPTAAALGLFLAVVAAFRYVSLGSILAAAAFPVFVGIFGRGWTAALVGLPIVLIILVRHAPNIRRLLSGREPKLGSARRGPA